MHRMLAAGIAAAILLTGCTGTSQSPPPVAPTAEAVKAGPATPAPTASPQPDSPPPATTVPLPKVRLEEIAMVVVRAERPERPSALLRPATHDAQISAVLDALNALGEGRPRDTSGTPRYDLTIHFRDANRPGVTLQVLGAETPIQATWEGKPLWLESPALYAALASLEGLMQPARVGAAVWAVDLAGAGAPELLLEQAAPLNLEAVSPDGRFWLLIESLAEYKGDYRAIPYLYDRQAGQLRRGEQVDVRGPVYWSGHGFFIDRLVHLDLSFQVERYPTIREALGLQDEKRALIAFSPAAGGNRFFALVGHPSNDTEPLDLAVGTLDGQELNVIPGVVKGAATQIGVLAGLALSPDGEALALMGGVEGYLLRTADAAKPEAWIPIQSDWFGAKWSPDSRYLAAGGAVYDQAGKVVTRVPSAALWHPDSSHLVTHQWAQDTLVGLDGSANELIFPVYAWPVAFLPDGRLLVTLVNYPVRTTEH